MPDTPPAHRVKIFEKSEISHNVNRWVVEKPAGYTFTPGHATEVALDQDGYREKKRPFTFTSLPDDITLEFVIKTYPERDGVTDELDHCQAGDYLLIGEPFGAIQYQGEGTFIAGGAGVTPFISILRKQFADNAMGLNRLIFANNTADDVFLKTEFDRLLGDRALYVLSDEDAPFADRRVVDKGYLAEHCSGFSEQVFYLCGPPGMGEQLKADLLELGASEDNIVHEDWSD